MSFEWPRDLFESYQGVVLREGVSLGRLTTIGVGGQAPLFLEPQTLDGARETIATLHDKEIPFRVLGGGSNVLLPDGDLPYAVISFARLARVIRDDGALIAWAGASFPGLVRGAMELGLDGIGGLVGIPGQVGGAVRMNAGGKHGWFWDVIHEVELIRPDGTSFTLARADAHPTYRNGGIGENVALSATLALKPGDKKEIYERMQAILREKHRSQPLTEKSAGCIFKNPKESEHSAGRLIELAGMKGTNIGDAEVSRKHGNFIINRGAARSKDVFELIGLVREAVKSKFDIELELEIDVWRV